MFDWIKEKFAKIPSAEVVFEKVTREIGVKVEAVRRAEIIAKTKELMAVAFRIGKNLCDLNGDGKIDEADLKIAAEKAGIVWDKLDPDFKKAFMLGGAVGVATNVVPLIGSVVAVKAFVLATCLFYIKFKLES
jgi:hypothetical protein